MAVRITQSICLPDFSEQALPLSIIVHRVYFMSVFLSIFELLAVAFFWMHCWSNVWAELLRFGDRRFYSDYYTTTEIGIYFRKWNLIIQGWLYRYVFVEFASLLENSMTTIFVLSFSGIMHDLLMFSLSGLFLPVYAINFPLVIAVSKIYLTNSSSLGKFLILPVCNIFQSLLHFFFLVEFYSRKNCPLHDEYTLSAILTPRTFSCLAIDTST
jgi:hypothetical protein